MKDPPGGGCRCRLGPKSTSSSSRCAPPRAWQGRVDSCCLCRPVEHVPTVTLVTDAPRRPIYGRSSLNKISRKSPFPHKASNPAVRLYGIAGRTDRRRRMPSVDQSPLVHALCLPGASSVTVRPADPHDADVIQAYIRELPRASRYNRFLGAVNELSPSQLRGMTHTNRRDRLSVIAETVVAGARVMIGEACYALDPDGRSCEIALSVAAAWQRDLAAAPIGVKRVARLADHHAGTGDDARLIRMTKDLALLDDEPARE